MSYDWICDADLYSPSSEHFSQSYRRLESCDQSAGLSVEGLSKGSGQELNVLPS